MNVVFFCRYGSAWVDEWDRECTCAQYLMGGCGEERKWKERKVFARSWLQSLNSSVKVGLLALRWTDRPEPHTEPARTVRPGPAGLPVQPRTPTQARWGRNISTSQPIKVSFATHM
ncbi:hypothetical protein ABG768_011021 [Culter alburnus]|uniref:Uncharacterized protein n=1 Tax=Culter alburnus TaxID=194366 RepID=A0AAW1ZDI2_CULAL